MPRLLAIALALYAPVAASGAPPDPLVGIWSGKATCAGDEADLWLRFAEDAKGEVEATFDLPVTNVVGAPLGKVTREGDAYRFAVCRVELAPASASAKETLTGTLEYQGSTLRFELGRVASAPTAQTSRDAESTAAPVWSYATGGPVWSSPAVAGGLVYIGSNDGCVYALLAESGDLAWQLQTGGAVVARPTVASGALYVVSDAGPLLALDARTGEEAWRFDLHAPRSPRDWPSLRSPTFDYLASAAVRDGGTVYVGSGDKRLYAVDAASGAERWHFDTQGVVRSTPAVAGGAVVFGSYDGCVYALDAATGALRWKRDTLAPVVSSPVVHGGSALVGSRSANVLALALADGSERWRHYCWLSWIESSGAVRDGSLYVGTSDYQRLLALDVASGRARWTFDTDGSAWSSPAVTDETVYIGAVGTVGYMADHRGAFFAVDRSDGREKWRYAFPRIEGSYTSGVASSPAVADGRVYFGALDGSVYAFAAE